MRPITSFIRYSVISDSKGSFGNIVLVTLFKYCGNTYEWKSIVEILVVLSKQWKLLFKQYNQTDPRF